LFAPQGDNPEFDEVAILRTGGSASHTTSGFIAGYTKTNLTAGILKELLDAAKQYTMYLHTMEHGKWLNNDSGQTLVKAINKVDDLFNR